MPRQAFSEGDARIVAGETELDAQERVAPAFANALSPPEFTGPLFERHDEPRSRALLRSMGLADLFYVDTSTTNTPGRLWQLPLKGGDAIDLADGVLANSFEVVDDGIYYLDRISKDTRLRYFDLTTRLATTVAEKLGNVSPCLGVSRDGRTILFARADSTIEDLMLVEHFR